MNYSRKSTKVNLKKIKNIQQNSIKFYNHKS